jgi:predicted GIY-YIG superfamily endonuclease
MHYAYILQSIWHPERFYFGSTSNLKNRFAVHNAGGNTSTRPFVPWKIAWYGGFPSKKIAMEFERYLKTASGKAFARKRLVPPFEN